MQNKCKKSYKLIILAVSLVIISTVLTLFFTLSSPVLFGYKNIRHIVGSAIPNLKQNVKAYSIYGGNISKNITVSDSQIDWQTPGSYTARLSVANSKGRVSYVDIAVNVVDVKPNLILTKTYTHIIDGNDFNLLSLAQAYDNNGKNITCDIQIEHDQINWQVPGNYNIQFYVCDSSGNLSKDFCALTIMHGAPILNIKTNKLNISLGMAQFEKVIKDNAVAVDQMNVNITNSINVNCSNVDINTVGEYEVYYTVVGMFGATCKVYATVIVFKIEPDIIPPEITVNASLIYQIPHDNDPALNIKLIPPRSFLLQQITAYDNIDGDVLTNVQIDLLDANFNIPGIYTIRYTVSDSSGNYSQILRQVIVKDLTPPKIMGVFQGQVIIYKIGSDILNILDGVTAYDNVDGNCNVAYSENINYNQTGNYTITYTSIDSAGNVNNIAVTVKVIS